MLSFGSRIFLRRRTMVGIEVIQGAVHEWVLSEGVLMRHGKPFVSRVIHMHAWRTCCLRFSRIIPHQMKTQAHKKNIGMKSPNWLFSVDPVVFACVVWKLHEIIKFPFWQIEAFDNSCTLADKLLSHEMWQHQTLMNTGLQASEVHLVTSVHTELIEFDNWYQTRIYLYWSALLV